MRRTQLLLFTLLLFIILLVFLKIRGPLILPNTSPITPSPVPTNIPTVPTILPTPTPSGVRQTLGPDVLVFYQPQNWQSSSLSQTSTSHKLRLESAKSASGSARFDFSLSLASQSAVSTSSAQLNCGSLPKCDSVTLDGVPLRLRLTGQTATRYEITYDTLLPPYYLKISGVFTGQPEDLTSLITQWDGITQTFSF